MKNNKILTVASIIIWLTSYFLYGQNSQGNLLVTDYGINQFDLKGRELSFFYENYFVYKLPKFSLFGKISEDKIMNEVTLKIVNYYKSRPEVRNVEFRLIHDMNSGSYAVGDIGYQQWSEKYHAAAQRGIVRAKEILNLNVIGYGASNGGRMIVSGVLENNSRGYNMPFDAIIFDEPQVKLSDFEKFIGVANPNDITIFNYEYGLNGNFRDAIPFKEGMISQPKSAELYPDIRFFNYNPPTKSKIITKKAKESHIYAAQNQFEKLIVKKYNHLEKRYAFFPDSRPIDIVNYEFHRVISSKQDANLSVKQSSKVENLSSRSKYTSSADIEMEPPRPMENPKEYPFRKDFIYFDNGRQPPLSLPPSSLPPTNENFYQNDNRPPPPPQSLVIGNSFSNSSFNKQNTRVDITQSNTFEHVKRNQANLRNHSSPKIKYPGGIITKPVIDWFDKSSKPINIEFGLMYL